MGLWHRKKASESGKSTVSGAFPMSKTSIPAGAQETPRDDRRFRGPLRLNEDETLVNTFVTTANDILSKYNLHASQVDGGLEFSRLPKDERVHGHEYSLQLEHVIDGLGLRYVAGYYPHTAFMRNDADDIIPCYEYTLDTSWASRRNYVFNFADMAALDQACANLIMAVTDTLRQQRVTATPTTIMGRLALDAVVSTQITEEVRTGPLLPKRRIDTPRAGLGYQSEEYKNYVPQIYFEYLRAQLPISYLLAAFMPFYRATRDMRGYMHSKTEEYVPRFNITDVYGMREQPIPLVLEMVGATRALLIESAQ